MKFLIVFLAFGIVHAGDDGSGGPTGDQKKGSEPVPRRVDSRSGAEIQTDHTIHTSEIVIPGATKAVITLDIKSSVSNQISVPTRLTFHSTNSFECTLTKVGTQDDYLNGKTTFEIINSNEGKGIEGTIEVIGFFSMKGDSNGKRDVKASTDFDSAQKKKELETNLICRFETYQKFNRWKETDSTLEVLNIRIFSAIKATITHDIKPRPYPANHSPDMSNTDIFTTEATALKFCSANGFESRIMKVNVPKIDSHEKITFEIDNSNGHKDIVGTVYIIGFYNKK